MTTAPIFRVADTPLRKGVHLIEASAGTGKTFTIAGLFLRLLLEQNLTARQILVVTYTIAATAELRGRIRGILSAALKAFETGHAADPLLACLLRTHADRRVDSIHLLRMALSEFDEAAITTIHGFCQRTLQDRAFESGIFFDTELIADQTHLLREVLEDFWRSNILFAGEIAMAFAQAHGLSPEALLPFVTQCLTSPSLTIISPSEDCELGALIDAMVSAFNSAREVWQADQESIRSHFGTAARWANDPYNNAVKMDGNFAQLDNHLAHGKCTPDSVKVLAVFATDALESKRSRRGKSPRPDHRFFEHCAALTAAKERFLAGLKIAALRFAENELPRRKAAIKVQYFDDLLQRLDAALDSSGGPKLIASLQQQFPSALIDEFQDTDAIQYRIFRRAFAGPESLLYLIGDPKQAIYSFRGADVFTYLSAAWDVSADRHYTLLENWRSAPGLVAATNVVFAQNKKPFVLDRIHFESARLPNKPQAVQLHHNGRIEPALQIWLRKRTGPTVSKIRAHKELPGIVASEIVRLLQGDLRLGEQKIRPEDIAVLVPENRQVKLMKDALAKVHVPSALHTMASVFDTREFKEIRFLLLAVAWPGNDSLIKAALTTEILGYTARDIERIAINEDSWQLISDRFHQYLEVWARQGFVRMFHWLLHRESVRQRIVTLPDGERRITNILHLSELLHQASSENSLGVAGLLQWIADECHSEVSVSDEHQLRLERDGGAVQLVTIHKSKGLEYPIVFCPFSWNGSTIEFQHEEQVYFHDANFQLLRDLGSPDYEAHVRQAKIEKLAESVRLLYVTLTRAKHRCYVVWGGFHGAETSAPAWLLHPPADAQTDPVTALETHFTALDDAALLADLNHLREIALKTERVEAIAIQACPIAADLTWQPPASKSPLLNNRQFGGSIRFDWRVASFSSLTASIQDERPDFDQLDAGRPDGALRTDPIDALPRGVKTGTCLHKILERVDFQAMDRPETLQIVEEELPAHGLSLEFSEIVREMLSRAVAVHLQAPHGFRLSDIPISSRLNELEFCFPLKRIAPARLMKLLNHPEDGEDPGTLFFSAEPVQGFLKGYIDLVIEAQGRFYIVDWKSNWLGEQSEDYGPEALHMTMRTHRYDLQYLLYSLALDKYLALRRPGYSYDAHFGGVFYIFLRGVDPARPALGVFRERPGEQLIRELAALLCEQ